MRTFFFSLPIFIFIPLLAFSQHVKVNTWYDKEQLFPKETYYVLKNAPSVLDSLYIAYYHNQNIRIKGNYRNNKPEGHWEYFYENGHRKMTGEIKGNSNFGIWTYYYENGNRSMEGQMLHGKKNGKWELFYENEKIKACGIFVNGKKEGIWKYYNEDGSFKAHATYSKDKGKYEEFYESGKLKSAGEIVNGKSNGLWKYYYETNTLKAKGYEKEGLKEGLWEFYHPNGKLASEGGYENGIPQGDWKFYYENGTLSSEGEKNGDQKNGYWALYYKNGAFKGEGKFKNGEGPYKEFYESGKLKVEGYIKNGKNEGNWKYYYETGQLEGSCHFTNGKGFYTGYYPNKKIKMEGMLVNGDKTGLWKLYNKKGDLTGYYKTYYEGETPILKPAPVKQDSGADSLSPYKMPSITIPHKKSRYFTPKVNEFKGFALGINPLSTLFGSLPITFEYYLQERLGYEIGFLYHRNPFFIASPVINEKFKTGYSIFLQQKFYQQDQQRGMFYFGHEFRFSAIQYKKDFVDSSLAVIKEEKVAVNQKLYEYSIIIGDRIMGDANKSGYTFDVYLGIGIGYRVSQHNWNNSNPTKYYFGELKENKISIPVRFGIQFGYILDKKKIYKKLGIW